MVIVPVVLVAMFFTFVAAEQYGSVSRLTVRGTSASTGTEFGCLLGGFCGALTDEAVDSYVLVEYFHSPEVVQALIDRADFLRVYTRPEADPWYRLDPNAPMEDLVDYWEMMSSIYFNPETQISELIVRAFRPEDSERIARTVLEMSENLVNELSQRAREDALRMANEEVKRAEARFRQSRAATALYRDTEREIDPVATATAQATILGALEGELAQRQAEMNALLTTMSPQSPRVIYVRTQIDALRQQIKNQRTDLAASGDQEAGDEPALTTRLSRYEELLAEQTFADVALQSARQSLETARIDADKQNRYLSVFVTPTVPQDSEYPEAIRWTAIVGVGCLLLWGVFSLLSSIVRDHVT
jgi:capsular polysaccharide transport system permease protein